MTRVPRATSAAACAGVRGRVETDAVQPASFKQVTLDTTVQEKTIAALWSTGGMQFRVHKHVDLAANACRAAY